MGSWKVSFRLCKVQMLPIYIRHLFSNIFLDPSMFEEGHQNLFNQWSPTWKARFHYLKVEMQTAV